MTAPSPTDFRSATDSPGDPAARGYLERVYSGCLGKVLGVYLGRPFEMWSHDRITRELGPIGYYVADRVGVPLIVTDDDISGTFTFVRALSDYGATTDLTAAQVGQTWLNYIVENRTILWWGGVGNSTEHTAYLHLKAGLRAPASGSAAVNGRVVAEQIGAQIFIDAWALVSPGDPAQAAEFARLAGSVSHDGLALDSARMLAAMEAAAFAETDIDTLLDTGLSFVTAGSVIAGLVADLRTWRTEEPDWEKARDRLDHTYGNHLWGGNCHTVPNFGVIVLALLWGGGDWDKSMTIVNTAGWDTDCNSGNLGCLLGIRNGLSTFTGQDWRGPIADRMFLPTADGGRAVTDVATESLRLANLGRALAGLVPVSPKDGARFHFDLPGSVQGFTVTDPASGGTVENVESEMSPGTRVLRIAAAKHGELTATTPTFIPPEARDMPQYELLASPALSPGQRVRAKMRAAFTNTDPVRVQLLLHRYSTGDVPVEVRGPGWILSPGEQVALDWLVPGMGGHPIFAVGLSIDSPDDGCVVELDSLGWDGSPNAVLGRPADGGTMWRRAWIDAVDEFGPQWPESFRFVQNEGRGLLLHGCREWADLVVTADLTPHLASAIGVAARVQGLRRYYALLVCADNTARLIRVLDGEVELARVPFDWGLHRTYQVTLEVTGTDLRGSVDGRQLFAVTDAALDGGGIGLVVADGRAACETVSISSVRSV